VMMEVRTEMPHATKRMIGCGALQISVSSFIVSAANSVIEPTWRGADYPAQQNHDMDCARQHSSGKQVPLEAILPPFRTPSSPPASAAGDGVGFPAGPFAAHGIGAGAEPSALDGTTTVGSSIHAMGKNQPRFLQLS
jgi:hypothetical protein